MSIMKWKDEYEEVHTREESEQWNEITSFLKVEFNRMNEWGDFFAQSNTKIILFYMKKKNFMNQQFFKQFLTM